MMYRSCLVLAVTLSLVSPAGAGVAAETPEVVRPALVGEEYPGADAIFAEHGIKLLAGDGGLEFTGSTPGENCPDGQIQVEQANVDLGALRFFCFSLVGDSGALSLEIPNALSVRADGVPVRVAASEFGHLQTYDVDAESRVAFDSSNPETLPQAVVVELRADRSWVQEVPEIEVVRPDLVGEPISGADEIFVEYGIRLLAGDGGIRFAGANADFNCPSGQIQVEGVVLEYPYMWRYCFEIVAESGVLSLEIPNSTVVRGGDVPVKVTASEFGRMEVYDVDPHDWTLVDHSIPDELPQAVVVELRVGG